MRAIPDDNLAYPILISIGNAYGTGFYLQLETEVYLITAKHVLFDKNKNLISSNCKLLSYPKDVNASGKINVDLELDKLNSDGNILTHKNKDVCAVKVFNNHSTSQPINGVKYNDTSGQGITCVTPGTSKKLDEVLVSNETITFGYPKSIGLREQPQFDFERPLLSKGIVANKYPQKGTIILDTCVHPGNSGGPVLEIERDYQKNKIKYKVIGVISEFIPVLETWQNNFYGYQNTRLTNSGYSVAVAMDHVLELVGIKS